MADTGRNITPDKLPIAERQPLFAACDEFLRAVVRLQRPRMVIGIGAFAEARARKTLEEFDVAFGRIPHPSPASPLANRGWSKAADAALKGLGI
jgi:single-strand selective monofunctional uracil DNA glycosylase